MIPYSWTHTAEFTPLTWAVILLLPLVWPLLMGLTTAYLTNSKKEK